MKFYRIIIIFLFIAIPVISYSQTRDTIVIVGTTNLLKEKSSVDKLGRPVELTRYTPFLVPLSSIGYGLITLDNEELQEVNYNIRAEIKEDYPHFFTGIDNYLQYAPTAAVYALNLMGVKGEHNFKDRSMIYLISSVIMGTTVYFTKKTSHRIRPDGSAYSSFPSGHTATAFAAAEFLSQEYKGASVWYGIAGYTVATATGVLRMYNNRHWFSDVVAGAGVGIISTKLAYLIYPIINKKIFKKKNTNSFATPFYQNGSVGVIVKYTF